VCKAQFNRPVQTNPAPRNTLGLVSFLFSVLGVLTCGMLGPVALLLSLLALLKRPRGFATAGFVIGLLSTLWLGAMGAAIVTTVTRLEPVAEEFMQELQRIAVVSEATQEVQRYREQHGDWPDETAGQELVGRHEDAYGTPLRYTRVGEMVLVISAGADREFATADDVSLDPAMFSADKPESGFKFDLDD
jgi:hypothetical protein